MERESVESASLAARGPDILSRPARSPEDTLLHRVVRENLETFLVRCAESGRPVPAHVEEEFRRYLSCGVLAHGFVRTQCSSCGFERIHAFRCKGRGFCPSCFGRRMADNAAFLVDSVLPERVGYRQWVLSLPIPLRFWCARSPGLLSRVIRIHWRAIERELVRASAADAGTPARAGAVTLVQRFGGSGNLNVHLHTIAADGVFEPGDSSRAGFRQLGKLDDENVRRVLSRIQRQVVRMLVRRGYLDAEAASPAARGDENPSVEASQAIGIFQESSLRHRHAMAPDGAGPNVGPPLHRVGSFGPSLGSGPGRDSEPERVRPLCYRLGGFSLHAGVSTQPEQREKLEHLARYVSRPPLAAGRLVETGHGELLLRFKRPWADGSSGIRLSPIELLARLSAIIPPPRAHLTRYHGAFAPRYRHRGKVVPTAIRRSELGEIGHVPPRTRLKWAVLLKRVFQQDFETCPKCQEKDTTRIVAAITKPEVIRKILRHLRLPDQPLPTLPARAPPQPSLWDTEN